MVYFRMWCTHSGQEVLQLVYTLLTCKLAILLKHEEDSCSLVGELRIVSKMGVLLNPLYDQMKHV